jgi:putative SOS response-associated peptidase YedK
MINSHYSRRRPHERGSVYSGLMSNRDEAIRPVHDRMPVLLPSSMMHGCTARSTT